MIRKWLRERRYKREFNDDYVCCMRKLAADPTAYKGLGRFPGSPTSEDALDAVLEDIRLIEEGCK